MERKQENEKKNKTNMVLKYLNNDYRFNDFTFQCVNSPTYDAYGIYGGINNKYVKYKGVIQWVYQ